MAHPVRRRNLAGEVSEVRAMKVLELFDLAGQVAMTTSITDPRLDFESNVLGGYNILECARRLCPDSIVIYSSTNKVYGDRPNSIPLQELGRRWDYADPEFAHGIPETFSIDHQALLFGASKVVGDVMVQEYGRPGCPPAASGAGA
jgi:CDP-paratose 2-epimerase